MFGTLSDRSSNAKRECSSVDQLQPPLHTKGAKMVLNLSCFSFASCPALLELVRWLFRKLRRTTVHSMYTVDLSVVCTDQLPWKTCETKAFLSKISSFFGPNHVCIARALSLPRGKGTKTGSLKHVYTLRFPLHHACCTMAFSYGT